MICFFFVLQPRRQVVAPRTLQDIGCVFGNGVKLHLQLYALFQSMKGVGSVRLTAEGLLQRAWEIIAAAGPGQTSVTASERVCEWPSE